MSAESVRADNTITGAVQPAPQTAKHFGTVDVGQAEVEDHDVGAVSAAARSAPAPVEAVTTS